MTSYPILTSSFFHSFVAFNTILSSLSNSDQFREFSARDLRSKCSSNSGRSTWFAGVCPLRRSFKVCGGATPPTRTQCPLPLGRFTKCPYLVPHRKWTLHTITTSLIWPPQNFLVSSFSFKHNTSFVSRFSTIRRHKSATHSPLARNRFGTSASEHGAQPPSTAAGATAATVAGTTAGTREDSLSGTRDTRMPGSLSEDSVAKEVSDASKRNSDGKYCWLLWWLLLLVLLLLLLNLLPLLLLLLLPLLLLRYRCTEESRKVDNARRRRRSSFLFFFLRPFFPSSSSSVHLCGHLVYVSIASLFFNFTMRLCLSALW